MRLCRYSGQKPKFLVFRRLDKGKPPKDADTFNVDGQTYVAVEPFDCFVLKKQDRNTLSALAGYEGAASMNGDRELAADVNRLRTDWKGAAEKMPD
jgi:hypothetical protein